jgi:hypothetical protein
MLLVMMHPEDAPCLPISPGGAKKKFKKPVQTTRYLGTGTGTDYRPLSAARREFYTSGRVSSVVRV